MYIPPGFDKDLALEAAKLVAQAYKQYRQGAAWTITGDYEVLVQLLAKPKPVLTKPLPDKELFGFVARNTITGTLFVTFRGTQSPGDWISNISIPPIPFKPNWGKVEEGFSALYWQMFADIDAAIAKCPGAPIVVTGHSLGGALSTIAAADLAYNKQKVQLYNFASPRTGDFDFASALNADSHALCRWRVVNTEDIVTTVPLASTKVSNGNESLGPLTAVLHFLNQLDYTHVGAPVAFTTQNHSIIDNHAIETYIAALSAA